MNAQHGEVVSGDQFGDAALGPSGRDQAHRRRLPRQESGEDLVALPKIAKHRVAKVALDPLQFLWPFHRKRSQQYDVPQAEDGRLRADPERQRHHGDCG